MTKLLIAGATGLVGRHVLLRALADERIAQVVAPTRRPLAPHARLLNPVIDFSAESLQADWWAVDGVVCTLGTTRAKAGSAAAFRAVDLELQLEVARRARAHGAGCLALTSATGADPRSRFLYMRTKGELEAAVAAMGWPSLTIVRPGFIGGDRDESRPAERLLGPLLLALGPVLPRGWRISPAPAIARVLLEAAIQAPAGRRVVQAAQLA